MKQLISTLALALLLISPAITHAQVTEEVSVNDIYNQLDEYLGELNNLLSGNISLRTFDNIDKETNRFISWLNAVNETASNDSTRMLANSLSAILQ